MQPKVISIPIENSIVRTTQKFPFNISNIVKSVSDSAAISAFSDVSVEKPNDKNISIEKKNSPVASSQAGVKSVSNYNIKTPLIIPKAISKGSQSMPVGIAVARQRDAPRLPAGARTPQQKGPSSSTSSFQPADDVNNVPSISNLSNVQPNYATSSEQRNYFASISPFSNPSIPTIIPSLCQPEQLDLCFLDHIIHTQGHQACLGPHIHPLIFHLITFFYSINFSSFISYKNLKRQH